MGVGSGTGAAGAAGAGAKGAGTGAGASGTSGETAGSAGAAGAVHVDAQVALVDLHFHLVGLRQHGHGGRGGVDAPLGLGLGHALDAVHAGLELHDRVHMIALHLELDLLEAAGLRRRGVHGLGLPALGRGEALVHLVEVAGKNGGLVAAGRRADLHDDVLLVGRVGRDEHELDVLLQLGQLGLDGGDLLLGELLHVGVGEHLLSRLQVVHGGDVLGRLLGERTLGGVFLGEPVVLLLIGEHCRIAHLGLQLVISLDDLLELLFHISFLHGCFLCVKRCGLENALKAQLRIVAEGTERASPSRSSVTPRQLFGSQIATSSQCRDLAGNVFVEISFLGTTLPLVQLGNKISRLSHKRLQLIEQNRGDDRPVDSFIIMNKPMTQSGNLRERNLWMGIGKLARDAISLFTDVVERRCHHPLHLDVREQRFRS